MLLLKRRKKGKKKKLEVTPTKTNLSVIQQMGYGEGKIYALNFLAIILSL